jgi:hypothetical protein
MKRLAIWLALVVLVAALAPPPPADAFDWRYPDAGAADDALEPMQDYYPLQVGNTWTYQVPAAPGTKIVAKVTKYEQVGSVWCARLETELNGNVTAYEHIAVRNDGIYRYSFNGIQVDRPVKILPLPARAAEQWTVKAKAGNETITGEMKTTEETVQVGGAKYKALVAGGKVEASGQTIQIANYFVRGIGVAKIKMEIAGQTVEVNLEKFERAK